MRIGQLAPWASPPGQSPPPPQPPQGKHGGGRARTSPQATQAVLSALDSGQSVKAAAKAGRVSWPTAKAIWKRERKTWPPPGLGKPSNGGGRPPRKLTDEQAAKAAQRIEGRETVTAVAASLKVSRQTLYRAIERLNQEGG